MAVDECNANDLDGRSEFCNSGGKRKGRVGKNAEELAYKQSLQQPPERRTGVDSHCGCLKALFILETVPLKFASAVRVMKAAGSSACEKEEERYQRSSNVVEIDERHEAESSDEKIAIPTGMGNEI